MQVFLPVHFLNLHSQIYRKLLHALMQLSLALRTGSHSAAMASSGSRSLREHREVIRPR
jgi:hypothetical protein